MAAPKRNRVLMLLQNYPYPADGRVREEAETLAASGYKVTVISPRGHQHPWHEVLHGVRIFRFPTPSAGRSMLGYLWEYAYSLVAIFALSLIALVVDGFDVVHIAQPPDALAVIAGFYKLLGKRYVLDHHDLSPELYYYARFGRRGNPMVYQTLLGVERFSFSLADRVISTNESYKAIALERGHKDAQHVTIVRNGPENMKPTDQTAEPVIPKAGRLIVGYLGVIGVQDGVDNLLRAVQHLAYELGRRDFLCVIVGTGAAIDGLKDLTHELHIEPFVLFTGWVRGIDKVSQYLSEMDICVAPEPSDPYNDRSTAVKVMEYMAAGKPIVSFDLPEHRVSAQNAAIYARPGDTQDLARKICELMDDPEQRARLGAIGRERIATELSWPHQANRLVELYAGLQPDRAR